MARILVTLLACAGLIAGCGSDDDAGDRSDGASAAGESASQGAGKGADEGKTTGPGAAGETSSGEKSAAEAAGEDAAAAEGDPAAEPSAAKPRRGPRLTLRDSQFGPVLFDGRNRALYLFTRDPRNKTRCYGACAEAWPPFYAKGRPRAGQGVDRSLLGTIERRDGRRQMTYRGQALYFYVDDPRGQVLCNDIVEFGGTWYAVDAKGNPPA
jgi:predicted lipoprotein with Yx(FWY)xxD motif